MRSRGSPTVRPRSCRRSDAARRRGAARRRARRGQGPVLYGRRSEPGGLADPRGLSPALYRDGRRQADRGGSAASGQDQPGRVRDGLVERELRLRAGAEPVGPWPRARRILRRQRRGRRGRPRAVGDRDRHGRFDPAAGGAVRDRRRQADLRGVLALRHDRVRLVAGPGGTAGAQRHRCRAAALADGRPRSA